MTYKALVENIPIDTEEYALENVFEKWCFPGGVAYNIVEYFRTCMAMAVFENIAVQVYIFIFY